MDLSKLLNIQANIAADVWPDGAKLRCNKCGSGHEITSAKCGEYLSRGWPKCCGQTMELLSVKKG